MTKINQTRQEIEARILERASHDPAFRQGLRNDPNVTISAFIGTPLPPSMRITVLEEQPGQHFLVLPPAPQFTDEMPLSELELALVGGGRTMRPGSSICIDSRRRGSDNRPIGQSSC